MAKRKSKVLKEYNDGTMSKAAFFGMIKAALRKYSMYWKPISRVRNEAKRPYKGPNKRLKWEYQCNVCKNYFPNTKISIDHIEPVGRLSCFEDIAGVVKRLFVEYDKLQCLCEKCHATKTVKDNKITKNKK